jgi:hypothetical protein
VVLQRTATSEASTFSRGGHGHQRWRSARKPAGERGGEEQKFSRAARQQRGPSSCCLILMEFCRLRRPISFPPSKSRGLERRAGDWQFSGARPRGVSCCSPTSFSSARVSVPFTPHIIMPVPLPCAYQRAETRSGLIFCHKRSVCVLSCPFYRIRSMREVIDR